MGVAVAQIGEIVAFSASMLSLACNFASATACARATLGCASAELGPVAVLAVNRAQVSAASLNRPGVGTGAASVLGWSHG